MDDLIAHVDKIVNPQSKVAPVSSIEVLDSKNALTPIDIGNISVPMIQHHIHYGVNQCISHIQNKILTVERNNPNNAVLTVLKQLTIELTQYL